MKKNSKAKKAPKRAPKKKGVDFPDDEDEGVEPAEGDLESLEEGEDDDLDADAASAHDDKF